MSVKSNNYLLARTDLGQVKKGFHDLPPQEHTYGKAPAKDKYGARQVIGSWEEAKQTESKVGGKDYISMNREGIKKGCSDSKKLAEFHKHNEIKQKVKEGQKFYGVQIPNEEFTYGVANRPSTPIKNVVNNTYSQNESEVKAEKEVVSKMMQKQEKKRSPPKVEVPKKHEDPNKKHEIQVNNFKLSKFQNVPSKIKPLIQKSKENHKQ